MKSQRVRSVKHPGVADATIPQQIPLCQAKPLCCTTPDHHPTSRLTPPERPLSTIAGERTNIFILFTDDVAATLAGLMEVRDDAGQRVKSLHVRTATLEDVFISHTGRRLRD